MSLNRLRKRAFSQKKSTRIPPHSSILLDSPLHLPPHPSSVRYFEHQYLWYRVSSLGRIRTSDVSSPVSPQSTLFTHLTSLLLTKNDTGRYCSTRRTILTSIPPGRPRKWFLTVRCLKLPYKGFPRRTLSPQSDPKGFSAGTLFPSSRSHK